MSRNFAIFAMLLAIAQIPAPVFAQAGSRPAGSAPAGTAARSASGSTTYTYPVPAPAKQDCNGVPCEDQQPRVIVTLPAPAPTPWPVHDRIAWAVYLVLAIVGYAGIMLAFSTLKKIERHTIAAEAAANAAAEAAHAALLHAQAVIGAERPWLLIGVEPTPGVENSFNVTATNRGRSPARITSAFDEALFAIDEAHLPAAPPLRTRDANSAFVPMILLPGEYASIRTIKRDDARTLAGSDEKFKSIEAWDERMFLVGRVFYSDLIAPAGKELHETDWCCWYIHGRQKSALTLAGSPAYHTHT